VSAEIIQTIISSVLIIGTALIAGSLGLKCFAAIDRRFENVERSIQDLRLELKAEIKSETGMLRSEIAGLRSDITQIALAVGARRAEG
jgi:hypothetical protein